MEYHSSYHGGPQAQCISIPVKSRTGSRVTAQAVKKLPSQLFGKGSPPWCQKHFRSQSMYLCSPDSVERASPSFPPSVEISVYRQEAVLAANLNSTCEDAVMIRHDGVVRKGRSEAVAIHSWRDLLEDAREVYQWTRVGQHIWKGFGW